MKTKRVVRVTEVLDFVNSSWKEWWHRKAGFKKADKVSREAAGFGTKVHELVEHYLKTGETDFSEIEASQDHVECADLIITWIKENKVKPLHIEILLKDEKLGLTGHPDCIAEIDGELAVFDWKTSKKHRKEFPLQKAAYAYMAKGQLGLEINRGITVRVDKEKKKLDVKEYADLLKKYWPQFKACLTVYRIFK